MKPDRAGIIVEWMEQALIELLEAGVSLQRDESEDSETRPQDGQVKMVMPG